MDPALVVALVLLAVLVVATARFMQDAYAEPFEDDREFFRRKRPRVWGLLGEASEGVDEERPPGRCPACGTDNEPYATLCRECSRRLPRGDG